MGDSAACKTVRQDARQVGVHGMYTHQHRLKDLHDNGLSWRAIQRKCPEYANLSIASLDRLAQGREPGPKVRELLGLPPVTVVVVIGGGQIPEGAQVYSAEMCECGQVFVSNHPRRRKCFVCSPVRKGGKHAR